MKGKLGLLLQPVAAEVNFQLANALGGINLEMDTIHKDCLKKKLIKVNLG